MGFFSSIKKIVKKTANPVSHVRSARRTVRKTVRKIAPKKMAPIVNMVTTSLGESLLEPAFKPWEIKLDPKKEYKRQKSYYLDVVKKNLAAEDALKKLVGINKLEELESKILGELTGYNR
ncbi:MAG: hypothetical protein COB50_01990, partial [Thiotrichales bacterium]